VFYLLIFNYFCIMKKISLKGVQETLSDWELKNVVGGKVYERKVEPEGETPAEGACKGHIPGTSCKMGWSGGESPGICLINKDTEKMECYILP
jgi:hypothetical protein